MPGFHRGRPPRNQGRSYPADPPTLEEIVAVMPTPAIDRPACDHDVPQRLPESISFG
jgi:hypothetical protein